MPIRRSRARSRASRSGAPRSTPIPLESGGGAVEGACARLRRRLCAHTPTLAPLRRQVDSLPPSASAYAAPASNARPCRCQPVPLPVPDDARGARAARRRGARGALAAARRRASDFINLRRASPLVWGSFYAASHRRLERLALADAATSPSSRQFGLPRDILSAVRASSRLPLGSSGFLATTAPSGHSTPNGAASNWRLLRDVAAIAVRDLAEPTSRPDAPRVVAPPAELWDTR